MRIATLQFSPQVGEVSRNVEQAEAVLDKAEAEGRMTDLSLLVLPEMAFSGYNFTSLAHITPFLEPTAAGLSTRWAIKVAKRLCCVVAVGYPEICSSPVNVEPADGGSVENGDLATDGVVGTPYNSLVFVDAEGSVIAHHRKAFLYYTDDTWAKEGANGFYEGKIPLGRQRKLIQVAAGICMDINPHKFEAPFTLYEFATHCQQTKAQVVVVSMAWLTRLSHTEVYGMKDDSSRSIRELPDMDTVGYWIERFRPLLLANGCDEEVIVIFANRAGEEGEASLVGEVRYAGSSCVMGVRKSDVTGETNVRIWDILGRGMDSLLVVDTTQPPRYRIRDAMDKGTTDDNRNEEET